VHLPPVALLRLKSSLDGRIPSQTRTRGPARDLPTELAARGGSLGRPGLRITDSAGGPPIGPRSRLVRAPARPSGACPVWLSGPRPARPVPQTTRNRGASEPAEARRSPVSPGRLAECFRCVGVATLHLGEDAATRFLEMPDKQNVFVGGAPAILARDSPQIGLAAARRGRPVVPEHLRPHWSCVCSSVRVLKERSDAPGYCAPNHLEALHAGVGGATIRERPQGWVRPGPSFTVLQGESTPQVGFPLLCRRCELRFVRCALMSRSGSW